MSKVSLLKKFGLLLTLFLLFNFVSAQQVPFPVEEVIQQPGVFREDIKTTLGRIFEIVLRVLTWLAGALAVGFIIWGGIQVIMQGKLDEGKTKLIYGVVGLIIALIAYGLVVLIRNFVTSGQL